MSRQRKSNTKNDTVINPTPMTVFTPRGDEFTVKLRDGTTKTVKGFDARGVDRLAAEHHAGDFGPADSFIRDYENEKLIVERRLHNQASGKDTGLSPDEHHNRKNYKTWTLNKL